MGAVHSVAWTAYGNSRQAALHALQATLRACVGDRWRVGMVKTGEYVASRQHNGRFGGEAWIITLARYDNGIHRARVVLPNEIEPLGRVGDAPE